MKLSSILAVAVAALLLTTGAAVAAPGSTPGNSTASEHTPNDHAQGPPTDLPGPVPDFVSGIHQTISEFLSGDFTGSLGEAISEITPGNESGSAADASPPSNTPQ